MPAARILQRAPFRPGEPHRGGVVRRQAPRRGDDADRHVLRRPYAVEAANLRTTLLYAGTGWRDYGLSRWARHELFPPSLPRSRGGQWVPNYQYHLIGSGMVSAQMTEWFAQHGVAHPVFWSAVTMTD